jgi:ketosteroid isomerase-like protein
VCGREILLKLKRLTVTDSLSNLQEGDVLEWTLSFSPDVTVEDGEHELSVHIGDQRIAILLSPDTEWEVKQGLVSPTYGVEHQATFLHLKYLVNENGEHRQKLVLEWN